MLFSPAGLSECVREWEDLEKDYQQIQWLANHHYNHSDSPESCIPKIRDVETMNEMSMKIQNVIICISKLSRPHMAEKFIGNG